MSNVDNCRLDITHDDECDFEDIKSDLLEEFEQVLDRASGFLSARQSPVKDKVTLDNRAYSAPSSPNRISNVQNKIEKFESFIANNYPNKIRIMSGYKKDIEVLANSRNASKAWVTRTLNTLIKHKSENSLNNEVFDLKAEQIKKYINKIEEKESEIAAIYDANKVGVDAPERTNSIDTTFEFIDHALVSLSEMSVYLEKLKVSEGGVPDGTGSDSKALAKAILDSNSQFAKIKLDCPVFLGNHTDKFEFVNWLAQ